MNKSVRTVQRWEEQFGLPIRRPDKRDPGTVLALPEELDLWMQQHTVVRAVENLQQEVSALARSPQIGTTIGRLQAGSNRHHDVRQRSHELLSRTEELLTKVHREMLRLQVAVKKGQALYSDLKAKQPNGGNGGPPKNSRVAS
jgi:hypothetical protein